MFFLFTFSVILNKIRGMEVNVLDKESISINLSSLKQESMMKTYTYELNYECAGESYPFEIEYEIEDGRPIIYQVKMRKKTTKTGGIAYDFSGNPTKGPRWIEVDLTDFMSPKQLTNFCEEITADSAALRAVTLVDRLVDAGIEDWCRQYEPTNYSGAPVY
jgi:hypothetical protein